MNILSFLGVLGIGGIIGIVLKSIFDFKIENRKMIFLARTRAYAGISGRIFNLFLEPDITSLPIELQFAKLNSLLSEVNLLGSHQLNQLLSVYKNKVFEFHKALNDKDEVKGKELHSDLVQFSSKIFDQMRKDLKISSKTVWEW